MEMKRPEILQREIDSQKEYGFEVIMEDEKFNTFGQVYMFSNVSGAINVITYCKPSALGDEEWISSTWVWPDKLEKLLAVIKSKKAKGGEIHANMSNSRAVSGIIPASQS